MCHGYSLAHTIRPLIVARTLHERGYHVAVAGRGPHMERIRREVFEVFDVETMPQTRMDAYVERGQYGYYDLAWIDRCVQSERALIRKLKPHLVIHDMKPTVSLSTRLEGVDEARITQAYNQPGYPDPIELMESFSTVTGPFDEYLAQHAEQVKTRQRLYLMADIPEFHPPGKDAPGFHYVGPLLDQPAVPKDIPLLDEGWNADWPLIYLSCGSSGREPDYLGTLIEAVEHKPWRVLMTTAGRWKTPELPANVRAVEFMPGEWVLRQAKVAVGVLGIGAIYQALGQGVPIISAPEHLDQEFHLNQVEAHGVGIKIDRQAFSGLRIVESLERLLGDHAAYARRCAPYVGYVAQWEGGQRVGDLVDGHFLKREQPYRVDPRYRISEEEFLRRLNASTPAELGADELREFLRQGMRRGLPYQKRGKVIYFDQYDSWNWLYDHEPRFFAADYWALEEKRQYFFKEDQGRLQSKDPWQAYRVTYRFRIYSAGLDEGQKVKLFIPYPVTKTGHQENVRLLDCSPELKNVWAPTLGYFYGHIYKGEQGTPYREFEYTCELNVRELAGQEPQQILLSPQERRRNLEIELGLIDQPEVIAWRRTLAVENETDEAKAREIYRRLVETKRFKKTKDPVHNQLYSTLAVLTQDSGHCITLSLAFVALCRVEGIPARTVSGALIGYPTGPGRFAARGYNEPLWGHTWAEVFLEGQGWVPVEFHSIVIGKAAMTPNNIADETLRRRIEENTARYQEYYFGRLDNQRLVGSDSVRRLPSFTVEAADVPEWDRKHWRADADVDFETQLEVECI